MSPFYLVLLVIIVGVSPLWAGVVFHVEQTSSDSARTELMQFTVDGKRFRIDMQNASGQSTNSLIYRGDRDTANKEMMILDHSEKRAIVMNREAVRAMAVQMNQMMQQMQAQMKNLPPDVRAKMGPMMPQAMGQNPESSKPQIRETGRKGKVNGYACKEYEIVREDGKQVVCATAWRNIPGGDEAREVMQDMNQFLQEVMSAFKHSSSMLGNVPNTMMGMDMARGYPLRIKDLHNDKVVAESILQSVKKHRNIDPTMFEAPAAYRTQSLNMR